MFQKVIAEATKHLSTGERKTAHSQRDENVFIVAQIKKKIQVTS